jgi:hypothetical protein
MRIIFSPIVHSHNMAKYYPEHHGQDWSYWKRVDARYISACNEVWVLTLDGWYASIGVSAERKLAQEMGKPLFYIDFTELQNHPENSAKWLSKDPPIVCDPATASDDTILAIAGVTKNDSDFF